MHSIKETDGASKPPTAQTPSPPYRGHARRLLTQHELEGDVECFYQSRTDRKQNDGLFLSNRLVGGYYASCVKAANLKLFILGWPEEGEIKFSAELD